MKTPPAQPGEPPGAGPLLGLARADLQALSASYGQPAYRGRQLAGWLYARRARSFQEMSDLPQSFRERLGERHVTGRSHVAHVQTSRDGTRKLLLELKDGARIETVVLPYEDRTSVCVSSQVGCPVGCTFCATATMGFARNLSAGEMVDQVLTAADHSESRISHVVVMGMGEPMLNYDAVIQACRLLREELGISYRRQTLSTAGHVPGILRLAEEGLPITLALSLHAPEDSLRGRLIPMSRKWGVTEVMDAVDEYVRLTGRRVTLEYLLLGGLNDAELQARQLAELAAGRVTHVNLIPWNPAASREAFAPPTAARTARFREVLVQAGVPVTTRMERGQDIDAACGQLAVLQGPAERKEHG